MNTDLISNKHGNTYGKDMCRTAAILPLSHLRYKNHIFPGDFTYFKWNKKSQIDFAYTSKEGLKYVKNLHLHRDNWHSSDHMPISTDIASSRIVNCAHLLKRAKELNYEFNPRHSPIVRHTGRYDIELMKNHLIANQQSIENEVFQELRKCDINSAILKLDKHLHNAHRTSSIKRTAAVLDRKYMDEANREFRNSKNSLNGQSRDTPDQAYEKYQTTRNAISKDMLKRESNKWNTLLKENDSKKLWSKIDWKGNVSSCAVVRPDVEDLAHHFEKLYSPSNPADETSKIENLSTNAYVTSLDDPISRNDIDKAMKNMKKGGFDYGVNVLQVLVQIMSPLLLLLFNIMFYVSYPVSLAKSLLIALRKKKRETLHSQKTIGVSKCFQLLVLYTIV